MSDDREEKSCGNVGRRDLGEDERDASELAVLLARELGLETNVYPLVEQSSRVCDSGSRRSHSEGEGRRGRDQFGRDLASSQCLWLSDSHMTPDNPSSHLLLYRLVSPKQHTVQHRLRRSSTARRHHPQTVKHTVELLVHSRSQNRRYRRQWRRQWIRHWREDGLEVRRGDLLEELHEEMEGEEGGGVRVGKLGGGRACEVGSGYVGEGVNVLLRRVGREASSRAGVVGERRRGGGC